MKVMKMFRLDVRPEEKRENDRIHFRATYADDTCSDGERRFWFVFTRSEFEGIVAGRVSEVADGYHRLSVCGDRWTFYDIDEVMSASKGHGRASVRFLILDIPRIVAKILLRCANRMLKADSVARSLALPLLHTSRTELEIPQATRERWSRVYGQGSGRVVWDFGEYYPEEARRRTEKLFESYTGRRSLSTLYGLAAGRTFAAYETAVVQVRPDGRDGDLYFQAGRFNGGVINHGQDGSDDWSVHT